MKKVKAYYAHSKRKYNSLEEVEEMSFIQKHFRGIVICPNKDLGQLGKMEDFLKVVKSAVRVYVTEYFGFIGKGVFEECSLALQNNIEVFVVRKDLKGKFFVQEVKDVLETNCFNFVSYGCLITK
jgi:hypothetical protein